MTDTLAPDTLIDAPLTIGGRSFRSRLMVGTGKYRDNGEMVRAIEASGAEIVTVAVRRVDLDRTKEEGVLYHLSPDQYFLLANTAGCYTADEAVRYARLAREAGFNDFVKLEVIGDQETLLPDTEGLLAAARTLVREGLQGPRLHQRRPDHRAAPRGGGLRRGHAARLADRQRARPAQSLRHPHDQAPADGAGHRGRRRRHRLGRLRHDGAGRGRHPDEHRARRGAGSGRHGARHAPRRRGRPRSPISPGRMPRREVAVPSSPIARDAGVDRCRHSPRRHEAARRTRTKTQDRLCVSLVPP